MDLQVTLAGLALKNPLLPGSGPPGDNLLKLQRLAAAGAGALVTKTISRSTPRVPKPSMTFEGELFFNIEKWSERPYGVWLAEILPGLEPRTAPLIVSLGYDLADLQFLVPRFTELADAFEISTHYLPDDPAALETMVRRVKPLAAGKPVLLKLSAHARDIVAAARACEAGGADAITAINSVGPVLAIDIEKRASRLGEHAPYAWLSGPAIKPIALRCVYDIARAVSIPVIACGGVSSGRDVIEFLMAGATAVECCTALVRRGPELIPQMLKEVSDWGDAHGISSVRELTGALTPHFIPTRESL